MIGNAANAGNPGSLRTHEHLNLSLLEPCKNAHVRRNNGTSANKKKLREDVRKREKTKLMHSFDQKASEDLASLEELQNCAYKK